MAIYRSARSVHLYLNCYENKGLLKKIQNRFKGFIEIPLNLSDFIKHNSLNMVLNNDIYDCELFELYNFEEIYNITLEDILNDPQSYLDIDDIESQEELEEVASEVAYDSMYDEVYQFYIIPEYEAERYWAKYTNYPIYYSEELEIFLIGITHWGMSWEYFETDFIYREYL